MSSAASNATLGAATDISRLGAAPDPATGTASIAVLSAALGDATGIALDDASDDTADTASIAGTASAYGGNDGH